MKRANTMSTITVELIIKMKTKFTSSNAEKTNGIISPQMSDIFSQMSYFHNMGSDSTEATPPSAVQRLLDPRTFKHLNVTSSLVATALTVMLIATAPIWTSRMRRYC